MIWWILLLLLRAGDVNFHEISKKLIARLLGYVDNENNVCKIFCTHAHSIVKGAVATKAQKHSA